MTREPPSVALIGGGDLNDSRGQLIEIKHITKHPLFDEESLSNDLAVVKLARRSHMPVACLWSHDSLPESPLTALGYGQTKFGKCERIYANQEPKFHIKCFKRTGITCANSKRIMKRALGAVRVIILYLSIHI